MMYRIHYRRRDGTEYAAPALVPSTRPVIEEFVRHHERMEGLGGGHRWYEVIAVVEVAADGKE
jgi:hypothetical protein